MTFDEIVSRLKQLPRRQVPLADFPDLDLWVRALPVTDRFAWAKDLRDRGVTEITPELWASLVARCLCLSDGTPLLDPDPQLAEAQVAGMVEAAGGLAGNAMHSLYEAAAELNGIGARAAREIRKNSDGDPS